MLPLLQKRARARQLQLAPDLASTEGWTKYQYTDPEAPGTTGPVGFCREVLGIPAEGYDPYPGGDAPFLWRHQQDIMLSVEVFIRTAVASCHAIGKDWTSARIVVWFLLCYPAAKVITTGPTDRQVKLLLWGEIHTANARAKKTLPGRLNLTEWTVEPEHYAIGFKSKDQDPERFAGFHAPHILYVVDEASGVEDTIFQAIEGGMSTGDARLLLIGNPLNPAGQFHRAFHNERAQYHTILVDCIDTPNFEPGVWPPTPRKDGTRVKYFIQVDWVLAMAATWGEDSPLFQARCRGRFPTEGTNTLISLVWVMNAQQLEHDAHLPQHIEPEMGVDVARYGDDESAYHIRRGPNSIASHSWAKRDTMVSAQEVARAVIHYGVKRVRVDVVGVGAGVFDRLTEMVDKGELIEMKDGSLMAFPTDVALIPVNVAEKPTDVPLSSDGKPQGQSMNFTQLRDQMWWNLREKFRTDEVRGLVADDVLLGQLTTVTYDYKTAKLKIEKKEDMKKRLGGDHSSPDRAEAMMLAYWDDGVPIEDEGDMEAVLADIGQDYEHFAGLPDRPF